VEHTSIPPRQPIGDTVSGDVIEQDGTAILLTTPLEAPAGSKRLANGQLTIRYGIRYLEKPFRSIVPGLIALDYGDILTGEAAWEFLHKRSNLHPRADVFGYRNDGEDDMIVVKWLDLAAPLDILVYTSDDATMPVATASAVICNADTTLPPRVTEYAPCYESIAAWESERESNP
jgi:hypothetical protein